ncbi:sulfatase-like hydrolase/transferase [Halomicrococcus sp. SG-WS-1]|uniref:sulfatase-like hydrolase/transferase n=1 Tax=Halomicrococcus sp. SG-WS-1 TaxID=3439057 RepID=UPI003F79FEFA
MPREDIVLVTVDCWRSDTLAQMPSLSAWSEQSTTAISAGGATNWAFPALLNSRYYPETYDDDGNLEDGLTPLPAVLADHGYATGGFVASNPFVAKWSPHFDAFWNDGMESPDSDLYSSEFGKWASRFYKLAAMRKRVPADEIIGQARDWYETQSGPRFLWLHLMDPHLPYYPGLSKAREVGLPSAYRASVEFYLNGSDSSESTLRTIRRLYRRCVERVDDDLQEVFDFVDDDAKVVFTGDHGEEFDHGDYDHESLYDEVVRTPLVTRNVETDLPDRPVRQIDLPPTLLDEVDVDAPASWTGDTFEESTDPAYMISYLPNDGHGLVGVRTDDRKLIRTFDDQGLHGGELFDLESDPGETVDRYGELDEPDLEQQLREFVERVDAPTGEQTGVDDDVNSRLEELGYLS